MLKSSNKKSVVPGKNTPGVGVGAFILNKKGELLLMYRPNTIAAYRTTTGMWSVPGGAIDFGETAEEAIKREVLEETGIQVSIEKYIGYSDQVLSNAHWISLHFLCSQESGTVKIMEPDKCERFGWFNPKKLPQNSGITHVLRPAYLLGYMSKSMFESRKKDTKES